MTGSCDVYDESEPWKVVALKDLMVYFFSEGDAVYDHRHTGNSQEAFGITTY